MCARSRPPSCWRRCRWCSRMSRCCFVAFAVPQIALRLTGGSRPPLVASAVYGACLVVVADLMCRNVLASGVPAGVVTACVGAPYLIRLLVRTNRRTTV
ncbi:iron chelate uptake ABC transporter family permease subunit [Streptomyces sp. SID4919]|nr:iron chelate uptake ABC transporter family permease subunit [Streptomyces sp. SID4919]